MPTPSATIPEEIRALTYALWVPGQRMAALAGLERQSHPAVEVALCDLVEAAIEVGGCEEGVVLKAVRRLGRSWSSPMTQQQLWSAMQHPSGPVRLEAVRALITMASADDVRWEDVIAVDPAPLVRRVACRATDDPGRVAAALDDPVWRVRRDAAHRLLALTEREPERLRAVLSRGEAGDVCRDHAVAYLWACLEGRTDVPHPPDPVWLDASWWDDDPAVMVAQLRHTPPEALASELERLIPLVGHQDGYPLDDWMAEMRRVVAAVLVRVGELHHWRRALSWLRDDRVPYAVDWALALLERHGEASDALIRKDLPALILEWPESPPRALAWARGAPMARMQGVRCMGAPPPTHRLRAAQMSKMEAQAILDSVECEPSWRVIAAAVACVHGEGEALHSYAPALLQGASVFESEPVSLRHTGPYFPMRTEPRVWMPPGRREGAGPPRAQRTLGGDAVSALAISGRYGLPEEGYELALSMGVNTFFWEPEYAALTRWLRSLPDPQRRALSIIGGTFASEPRDIARDLEQMKTTLGISKVTAFILFWVRSKARLSAQNAELLWEARARGDVSTFGLSTHDRGLALEALHQGWPTLMIRHSAGHHSAEAEVMPLAEACGAEIITFSNLCYGQMLKARGGQPLPFTAADCYRYALSQKAVKISLSAPRVVKQLNANLDVLADPTLSPERQAMMRAYTQPIRGETRRLIRLLRNVEHG
ncbi:MAG: hypothetical protein ACE366_11390 [Bradymonadia bacterium]